MTNSMPLESELTKYKTGKILSAHPKKPVRAVCQSVKEAVTSELNCRSVKSVVGYQRAGEVVARKMPYSSEGGGRKQSLEEGNINKAHIQEKKAKNMTYKKGNAEITLDELFLIQNGDNHGKSVDKS